MVIGKPNCEETPHPNWNPINGPRSDRLAIMRWSIFMAPWIGGCSPIEEDLIGNNAWLLTFFVSLIFFALVGGILVFGLYRKKLENWDLERNPIAPGRAHSKFVLIASVIIIGIFVSLFNLSISMPSGQHLKNILGWFCGSVTGCILAYWVGRHLATRAYLRSCRAAQFQVKRHLKGGGS